MKSTLQVSLIACCLFWVSQVGLKSKMALGEPPRLEQKDLINKLLASTMYVDGTDKTGNYKCWGTAFLIDKEKRLLLTNDHVINPAAHQSGVPQLKTLGGWFPARRGGRLVHDFKYYVDNVKAHKVTVLYGDKKRDLALIQVDTLPDGVEAIRMSPESSSLGGRLHSMAGKPEGSEGLWIYTQGTTRAVYERTLANGFKARTLEADMETNRGNSGGAVVDDTGRLVGVVEGHQTNARSVSMYIDIDEVRKFMKAATPLVEPQTIEHFLVRGDHHYVAGRYGMAMSDFTQALRRDPKNALAVSNRGWVFYQQDDLQTALADFNEAIKLDPALDYAYWGRAMVNYYNGDFDKASADMANAIRNCEDQEDLAEMYIDRAEVNLESDELEAALRDSELAVDASPNYAWGHACRGQALAYLDRLDEADLAFANAIKLDPTNSDIYNLLGTAFDHVEKHQLAIEKYTIAIKLNSENAIFFRNRASSLRQIGRFKDAAQDLLVAIKLAPKDDDLFNELGLVFYRAGDFKSAYQAFGDAIKLNRNELIYWLNRGDAALHAGDARQAIEDFTEVILAEDDADAYAMRGEAHQLLGNTYAAKKDYEMAIKLAPKVYRMFYAKYLQIANETKEPLKVYVQWYTRAKSGKHRWYPDEGRSSEYYIFKPGVTNTLNSSKNKKIFGARFHVWAVGMETGSVFNTYKNKDWVVVLEGGYVTDSQEPETELFRFVGSE